ncbi:MAG: glycoside hydrolase family 3 protein [Bacilli bacterium]|nr:glycoside hydrolase family 3 protein [Bacilli bacterium]
MKEEFLKQKLDRMSLQNKLGQMLFIDYRDTKEMTVDLEKVLTKYSPGGFIVFRSNMSDYNTMSRFLHDIKDMGEVKPIIAADHEGGRVQKLADVGLTRLPSALEIAGTMSEEEIFELAKKVGEELKTFGVDMDMAPVLDIVTNPETSRGIGDRSFGPNPEVVKRLSMAFAKGLKEGNVMAVGKHFPGHGAVSGNTHIDLQSIEKDLNELRAFDLIPFVEAINQKLPGIMIGHLAVPKVTGNNTPAPMSQFLISDLLKKDLGHEGIVVTDSLKMGALAKNFTEREIYLRCAEAGNDMLLMPQNINVAYETLYNAVNDGLITMDRIDDAVYRILSIKFDYGFFDNEYKEFVNSHNKVR